MLGIPWTAMTSRQVTLVSMLVILLVTMVTETDALCPMYCDCSYSRTVSCSSVSSIQQISSEIPPTTTTLEISGGNFYSLSNSDFIQMPATQLARLEITGSQLQDIKSEAFISMTQLQDLKLGGNQISALQTNCFKGLRNLQTLDLSKNRLQHFSHNELFKPLYSMQFIDLSDNSFQDIPNGLFSSQGNLQELKINGNKNLNNLRGTSFQGLRNLRKFLASGCSIRTLENDLFASISSVDTLDLSFNEIESLPSTDSFRQFRNLRNLTLQGNRITSLADGQFPRLDLDTLDLSGNTITNINPNAFKYLVGVRYLDLSRNKIFELPSYVFQPMASEIYSLNLNENKALRELPSSLFNGMQKMQSLNLSSCAIEFLDAELFSQVYSLRQIDISNNWLKNLPNSFIDRASYMQHVKLDNNPWHCDCFIKPLRTWLQYARTSSILSCSDGSMNGFNGFSQMCPKPQCSTPPRLAYHDISTLLDKNLEQCENTGASMAPKTSIIIGVVVGVLVVIIVIVIVVCCIYRKHKHGDPVLCYEAVETDSKVEELKEVRKYNKEPKGARREKRDKKEKKYYTEKKEKRKMDPDAGSLNESDKSFVVRNFFHSMQPDPDEMSEGTHSQSMTRKDSVESMSQSGIGYGSRHGSRHSSQYSLNAGCKFESAV